MRLQAANGVEEHKLADPRRALREARCRPPSAPSPLQLSIPHIEPTKGQNIPDIIYILLFTLLFPFAPASRVGEAVVSESLGLLSGRAATDAGMAEED